MLSAVQKIFGGFAYGSSSFSGLIVARLAVMFLNFIYFNNHQLSPAGRIG
jgi:hypothetical protein